MQRYSYIYILIFYFITAFAYAQKPEITNVSKKSAKALENIVIEGNGFDNDPAFLRVFFGAMKAEVISSTNNEIITKVPPGSSYDFITVTNLKSRLTGFSSAFFNMHFQGKEFDPEKLTPAFNFIAQANLNNICICDFDGDGKADIASSNNASYISIFRNTGTLDEPDFVRTDIINIHTPTRAITCEDLDGDGKKDIVVGQETGSQVIVIRNTSSNGSLNFSVNSQRLFITGNRIAQLKIADINNDGKPDIIAVDQQSKQVHIFENQFKDGFLEFPFEANTKITFSDFPTTNGLAVADLNNNGLPDIAVSSSGDNRLAILKNTSSNGTFAFESPFFIQLQNGGENLIAADVNGDGLNDLAITSNGASVCNIIINKSSSSAISFEDFTFSASIPGRPFAISAGDLNGDGKTDLLVTSQFDEKLIIFINKTGSEADFDVIEFPLDNAGQVARSVLLADINENGKSDIIFSNRDSNRLSILLNKNCIKPVFFAENKIITCESPLKLETTTGIGVTYAWEKDGVLIPDENEHTLEVTSGGKYRVILSSGLCSIEKEIEVIMQNSENAHESVVDIVAEREGLCEGFDMKIKTLEKYFLSYEWSHGNFDTPEVTITEPGVYEVMVEIEPGCYAKGEIEIFSLGRPDISIAGKKRVRPDEKIQLEASGAVSYRWEPEEGLSDPYIANPVATIVDDIIYTVTGVDEDGCVNEVSIEITVDKEILPKGRSLFSPNGDGVDDEWIIDDIEGFPEFKVMVFDSFGNKVYEHTHPENNGEGYPWDGTSKGKQVKEGAYYYIITSPELKKRITGSITIIR